MTGDFEDLYLQSEQAIKDGDLIRAKQLIENMLQEEPRSAIAHNSMGWFYRVQFEDYSKAEMHYKNAIRFNPDYPHAYWNYAFMLTELERFEELEKLLDRCLRVPSISKALIYNQLGEMRELQGRYPEAISSYREAIKRSVKNDQIEQYWESIKRVEEKIGMDENPIATPDHEATDDPSDDPLAELRDEILPPISSPGKGPQENDSSSPSGDKPNSPDLEF